MVRFTTGFLGGQKGGGKGGQAWRPSTFPKHLASRLKKGKKEKKEKPLRKKEQEGRRSIYRSPSKKRLRFHAAE